MAVDRGHEAIVRLLLEYPQSAPRADCGGRWAQYLEEQGLNVHAADGAALCAAAARGHESIVRLLLDWPEHAPCASGAALRSAIASGHPGVAELLLARLVPSGDAEAVSALRSAAAAESGEELAQALAALNTGG
jgi:hypothetical protein